PRLEKAEPPKPAVAANDQNIPAQVLQEIKRATVFVKVRAGQLAGSGSGFLIKTEGGTGYVVTNHHVIKPPVRPGRRGNPAPVPRITSVFNSGTGNEKSVPAQIVAADPARDLAVLKVAGVKDLPRPIDLNQQAEISETMPVFIFGFPFGEMLATSKGSPA